MSNIKTREKDTALLSDLNKLKFANSMATDLTSLHLSGIISYFENIRVE